MAISKNRQEDGNLEKFTLEEQKVLFQYFISDPNAFSLARNIVKPEYFEPTLRAGVRFVLEFADEFNSLPAIEQVQAKCKVDKIEKFSEISPQLTDWFIKEIEAFCKFKALELTALDALELIQTGKYGEYEQRVKDALTISLIRSLGDNYFSDPRPRLKEMLDKSNFISTGWTTLDKKLYGGFQRGTLNVFAGASGTGKSLFLQNLALNWAFAGLNVVYFSLELYKNQVQLRWDAMLSGMSTSDVVRNIDDIAIKVVQKGKKSGNLIIEKLPEAGTTTNVLRAFLKEYEIQTGIVPDVIIVDYLDLMYPNSIKVDTNSFFVKDKYVSEELRALAGELNAVCVTASQLNRQAVDEIHFDHSHIAGGISKINTSDNVFAIFAPNKEKGIVQIQFLKCRDSNATGKNIDLAYDANCMRISDLVDRPEDTEKPLSKDDLKKVISSKTNTTIVPSKPEISNSEKKNDILGSLMAKRRNNEENDNN